MSDPLRIAFVVEGPTDFIMLKSAIKKFLGGRDFVAQMLQPEISEAFKVIPGEDGGWPGVFRWCIQASAQGDGCLGNNPLFLFHDLLIFQLDADVARIDYSSGHVQDPFPNHPTLPCEESCPPASATTNRLRNVIMRWMGEKVLPTRIVLCIPSKALETWLLVGLYPDDRTARRSNIECRQNPADILQGKPSEHRLVRSGKKNIEMYKKMADKFVLNWDNIKAKCSEASRFENDFLYAFKRLPVK